MSWSEALPLEKTCPVTKIVMQLRKAYVLSFSTEKTWFNLVFKHNRNIKRERLEAKKTTGVGIIMKNIPRLHSDLYDF